MVSTNFLGIPTNLFMFALVWGVVGLLVLLCVILANVIMIRRIRKEFPEAIAAEFAADSPDISTKHKLVNLLIQLQEEKRILGIELDNMSHTQRESAKARIQKIEDKMERLINMSEYLSK